MFETLVPWYQKELSFLKREAMLFARRYPQLAARINLQENDAENLDPHADRLIQA
ncbi:MAG: type VI secretion system baseplate subunit TssF, partial [Acidobacteria bacterium]|nr:type VI secretion system baseplate subunit TssF [Acidobacteriota bacterium]